MTITNGDCRICRTIEGLAEAYELLLSPSTRYANLDDFCHSGAVAERLHALIHEWQHHDCDAERT